MIYRVAKVEEKKSLDGEATVQNIGLVDPDGGKHWPIEFYCHTADKVPAENSELDGDIIDGKYGGKEFKRAGAGGKGGGGGFRGRSLEDEMKLADHRSISIEAQVAAKIVADLVIAGKCDVGSAGELTKDVAGWIRGAK